jgi:cellulose synthase/poly-beta-1,6-N-acetylglucosamine synthase-like glycosyltransferase
MVALYLLLSVFFGLLAVHPFLIYPLTLKLLPRRPLQLKTETALPSLAICVCAYNEAAVIVKKAENLRALQQAIPGLKVYINIDCSSDNTAALLEPYREHFFIHVAPERKGKTYGMNLLVAQSREDIIIFTDANVMLDEQALHKLAPYFTDPSVGCVCGQLIYVNGESTTTAANGSLYWKIEEWLKREEGATGSVMGADGSIFAIRRALHQPPPADIIDDMYVSFSILCGGSRIISAPDVLAYEESVTAAREEFRRKVRIACQALNVHRLIWPRLRELPAIDLYKYISHKWLRWFVIYWLGASALFFLLALVLAGLTTLALTVIVLGAVSLALGAFTATKPFTQIYDILLAFVAVGKGMWLSLRGERFQTWTPAQSIRRAS